MSKKITVGIDNLDQVSKEFIDIWHQAEKGVLPKTPIEKISFKNPRLLFKTLTPKRIEILEHVHEHNGISILALQKELGRDYSNVFQDVKILYQLGLMIKNKENGKYYVPWDVIVTEIPLRVIKKKKESLHKNSPRRTAHS